MVNSSINRMVAKIPAWFHLTNSIRNNLIATEITSSTINNKKSTPRLMVSRTRLASHTSNWVGWISNKVQVTMHRTVVQELITKWINRCTTIHNTDRLLSNKQTLLMIRAISTVQCLQWVGAIIEVLYLWMKWQPDSKTWSWEVPLWIQLS
jgi:hypothetical protein